MCAHLPLIIVVRDPIKRLKTIVNHGWDKKQGDTFALHDNVKEAVDRRVFVGDDKPSAISVKFYIDAALNINFSYTTIAKIHSKVHYIDASEVNPDEVMQTMRRYAVFF